jgi:UrcA family protein
MKTFALAGLSAALLLSAGAASAQDHRIVIRDLDLGSVEGAAAFDARIAQAAGRACNLGVMTLDNHCRRRFRAEAMRQLGPICRDDYARGRASRVVAMVPLVYG